jgi:hypothetical protein
MTAVPTDSPVGGAAADIAAPVAATADNSTLTIAPRA